MRRPHQNNDANLSGQGLGRGDATSSGLACQAEVRGPEQARRSGGEAQVLEDLPDHRLGSMTAMTRIVPPHCEPSEGLAS